MSDAMSPALRDLVASRQLAALNGEAKRRARFSVSKHEAILALRAQAQKGQGQYAHEWDWTVYLVRAANALSEQAAARVSWEGGERGVLVMDFVHPGFELAVGRPPDGVSGEAFAAALQELKAPLGAALHADQGLALEGADGLVRMRRFSALVGRALNGALARGVAGLEFHSAVASVRFEPRADATTGLDPYASRSLPPADQTKAFSVRVELGAPGLGARVMSLFGKDDPADAVLERWESRLARPPAEGLEGSFLRDELRPVGPVHSGRPVELGDFARAGINPSFTSFDLVREGVTLLHLDSILSRAGLRTRPRGWVRAPTLRLTVDESDLVRDAAFDELVAWLHDMDAHTHETPQGEKTIWPERVEVVPAVSGRPVLFSDLRTQVEQGRELLYVERHRAEDVPAALRARVLALWPSELRWLRAALPEAKWIPVRALGSRPSLEPIDLTALEQGAYPPFPLIRGGRVDLPGAEPLRMSARAYLHRYAGATLGSILVLAYGRRVAHTRDHTRTIPGVTLVVELEPSESGPPPTAEELREMDGALDLLFERCGRLVDEAAPRLMAQIVRDGRAWDNPFMRHQLGRLDGETLGLRYVEQVEQVEQVEEIEEIDSGEASVSPESRSSVRLHWKAHPALELEVAIDDEGRPLTFEALLRRIADVGFAVVRTSDRRYPNLESSDPALAPIRLRRSASEFLNRVLGPEILLPMPLVAEAHPRVGGARLNAALGRNPELLTDDLGRLDHDERARLRVLGYLLVARASGADARGLEGLRAWRRFDPRALSTTRRTSLRALLAESPRPALAFPGAVNRNAKGVFVEVAPGLASLLARYEGFGVRSREDDVGPRSSRDAPGRRRAGPRPPLLRGRIDHAAAIGALEVAADGRAQGITVWSRGLKVGELRLPEPLGRVSGRLWLTARGRLIRSGELRKIVELLAADLLATAPTQRALVGPEDSRRAGLEALIEYLQGATAAALRSDARSGSGITVMPAEAAVALAGRLQDAGARARTRESFVRHLHTASERWPVSAGLGGSDPLASRVRHALVQKAPVDRATLSWRLLSLEDDRRRLVFGARNRWVQLAGDEGRAAEREPDGLAVASLLALDALFRDESWRADAAADPEGRAARHRRWALRSFARACAVARMEALAQDSA